jgi:hypothetical protein
MHKVISDICVDAPKITLYLFRFCSATRLVALLTSQVESESKPNSFLVVDGFSLNFIIETVHFQICHHQIAIAI